MRLASCLALELVVAVGAAGGVVIGVSQLSALARTRLVTSSAAADGLHHSLPTWSLERAQLHIEMLPPSSIANVFGGRDAELLAPLGASRVVKTKINHGGTSLSLRLDFEGGSRAAFKPEQIYEQSDPRKEIAAYQLDRFLQIGRIPPAKWIEIPVDEIVAGVDPENQGYVARRIADEALAHDGKLRGELSWWIPELAPATIESLPLDEREGREKWAHYLAVGVAIPEGVQPLLQQLAAEIVFDALVDNSDRWSGGNLQMSPDGSVLYTMDNTLSFAPHPWLHPMPQLALHRVEKFPKALIEHVRALDLATLAKVMTVEDGTTSRALLTTEEMVSVLGRRDLVMQYIDELVAEHGVDAVLSL